MMVGPSGTGKSSAWQVLLEPLEGVDGVLRQEIAQIRMALLRIEKGTYGRCSQCGKPIARKRLEARPIATRCVDCAS